VQLEPLPRFAAGRRLVYAEEWVWRRDLVDTLNARWREGWERIDMIADQTVAGHPGDKAWVLYKWRAAQ
jgi:hypothetical protein